MHIGLARNPLAEGPAGDPQAPESCVICGTVFVPAPVSGIAVDEDYHLVGSVCQNCLALDAEGLRRALRAHAGAVRESDPTLASHLTLLAGEPVHAPEQAALAAARGSGAGWANYLDDTDLGDMVYHAWFGAPVDADDQSRRSRALYEGPGKGTGER